MTYMHQTLELLRNKLIALILGKKSKYIQISIFKILSTNMKQLSFSMES